MYQLMKYIGEYRRCALMTPVWVVFETVCELFLTVTIGRFIDELSSSETTMALIYEYGIRLVIIAALCLVFGTICGWESVKAASGLSKNLRNAMFDRIQEFSFTNIDRFSTNSLVTRMTTDVANVQNAFMMMLRVAAKAPVSIACALVMAFSINWKIGLVYIIVIPILFIGLLIIARVTHPIFQRVFHTYDRLSGVVRENLHGIRVVKGFVREEHETEKFKGISEDIRRDFTKAETTIAFNPFLMQFSIYLCLILISWLSARAIVGVSGGISMTTGDLQNLITYAMMILMSLMMLSMIYVMTMISRECVSRIREVLAEQPTIEAPEDAVKTIENGEIDFEHVGFSYADDPDKLCLSDIDLHIRSGETIGIIGGTGSGKSSLVQLIPRLYDAMVGSVKVAGRDGRGVHRGGEALGRGQLHHAAAAGLRHGDKRRQQQPVPGPVPAYLDSARRRGRPAGHDTGRGDEQHRHAHRGHSPGRHGPAHGGPHGLRHCTQAVHGAQLQGNHGAGAWPHHRARQPRTAHGGKGPILSALHRRFRARMRF